MRMGGVGRRRMREVEEGMRQEGVGGRRRRREGVGGRRRRREGVGRVKESLLLGQRGPTELEYLVNTSVGHFEGMG